MRIYSFIFPLGESEFRTKMSFARAQDAATWAANQLNEDEFCLFREVPSSDYVFDPVEEAHISVRSLDGKDAWQCCHIF
jgi:hypothetical protein